MNILDYNALMIVLLVLLTMPLFYRMSERRKKRAAMLGSVPSPSRIKHDFLYILAALLIAVALLRPYSGYEEIHVPSAHSDTLVIVDISRSMLTRDLPPSRLEYAKRRIEDMLQYFAKNRGGDRIGLVLFAGEAYLYCPLTSDYSAIRQFAKSISADLISYQGTALKDALAASAESIKNSLSRDPSLLLLSDGEDDKFDVDEVLKPLSELKVPIDVIGVGTVDGRPIELENGRFVYDNKGKVVVSKLDESNLKALAEKSGGRYVRGSLAGTELNSFIKKSTVSQTLEVREEKLRIYKELGPYILLGILLVIMIVAVFGKLEIVAAALALACIFPSYANADEPYWGYKLYQEGKYKEALDLFKKEYEKHPDDKLLQAIGSTYYKLGEFEAAKKTFAEVSDSAKNGKRKFEAEYGLGNTNFMAKNYADSIKNYEQALSIKPDDEHTKYNLELAKKLLEEQKKQQDQQQKNQQQNQQKQDQDKKQDQQQQQQDQQQSGGDGSSSSSSGAENQNSSSTDQNSNSGEQQQSEGGSEASSSSSGNSPGQAGSQQDEQTQSASDTDQESSQQNSASYGAGSLTKSEADTWLDSLPEAPVLLQSKKQRRYQNGQSW